METTLIVAHTDGDGTLPKPAMEAVTAATQLVAEFPEARLIAWIVGGQTWNALEQIAGCGAVKVFSVSGNDFALARYSTDAAAVEALARRCGATLVLAPATSRFSRVLGGVAQRLNARIDTHVTRVSVVDGSPATSRWYYRQRMEAVLQRSSRPWVIALDPGCYPPWQGQGDLPAAESLSVEVTDTLRRTRVEGFRAPQADEQTIRPDADLLFVAGAGWTKKQRDGRVRTDEAAALILEFLRSSRASLGSSKSLVDLSGEGQAVLPFLTHLNQVGQTGSTPRHPKGLATCCHGEEPHVVGWRFISERRAVNLDPDCGWVRGKADVLYVADAFEVIARVSELLAKEPKPDG